MNQFAFRSLLLTRLWSGTLMRSSLYWLSTSSSKVTPLESESSTLPLSGDALEQCSNLMRRILSKVEVGQVKERQEAKIVEESGDVEER